MKRDAFSGFHPAVNFCFFVAVLGMTMFILQPVCLIISLLCGCAYGIYLQGWRQFGKKAGYLLPVMLMMAVMNPLFNHEGVTVLLYLPNDNPVTLEAVAFGLASAVLMAASILWFTCFSAVFTSDKIIYLFGRLIPALSLMISMTLRFVPRFMQFLQNVLRGQKAMHRPVNGREKLQQALSAFSATVSWAMEQSIVSADSMKSRGYGTAKRTAFYIYRFEKRDGVFLALLAVLCAGVILPFSAGWMHWTYYPALTGTLLGPAQLCTSLCYCGLCLMPLTVNLMEDHRWNLLRSEI